jgi:hypothetical protein
MDDGLIRQRPYFVSQEIDGSFSGASIRPATRPTGVKQPQGDPIGAGLTVHVGPPPIGRQTSFADCCAIAGRAAEIHVIAQAPAKIALRPATGFKPGIDLPRTIIANP